MLSEPFIDVPPHDLADDFFIRCNNGFHENEEWSRTSPGISDMIRADIAHEDFMLHMQPWRRRLDAVVGLSRTSYVGHPYGARLLFTIFARKNGKGYANGR